MTQRATSGRQPKVDPFKKSGQGKERVKVDPLAEIQQKGFLGYRQTEDDVASDQQLSPLLQHLQMIPVERIRPGRYQTRLQIDQQKYQQLVHQIKSEGFRHILIVCQDPDDASLFNPMMGGHIRLLAAQEAGIGEIMAFVEEYDRERLAKGTLFENQARQDLNMVEKGRLFHLFKQDLGWTQERIAEELAVDGGRDHIARCMLAAESAPDIQEMLMQEPDRGFRVLTYLRQLDVLGDQAAQMRAPIIAAFLKREITTDGVKVAVDRILQPTEKPEPAPDFQVPVIRRTEKMTAARKSWRRFLKEIGTTPLTEEERAELSAFQQEINDLLTRL